MKQKAFLKRLSENETNHYEYSTDGNVGFVNIWKHKNKIILTWEEFPPDCAFNEIAYTRDERHVFNDVEELFVFLNTQKISCKHFEATD